MLIFPFSALQDMVLKSKISLELTAAHIMTVAILLGLTVEFVRLDLTVTLLELNASSNPPYPSIDHTLF